MQIPLFHHKKAEPLMILKKVTKYGLILAAAFIAFILFYLLFQFIDQKAWVKEQQVTVNELTSEQKEADFRYLTQIVHDYYPFAEANKKIKGLEDLREMDEMYINKAKETTNNREFIELFNAYLQRLHQTGHAYVISQNEAQAMNTFSYRALLRIKKDSFNRVDYWFNLWKSISDDIHSDADVLYKNGAYYLAKDFAAGGEYIPKGSRILSINGMNSDEYVQSLQDKHWLRYDINSNKTFLGDPFTVATDDKKDFWNVAFELPNKKIVSQKLIKRFSAKQDLRFYNNSFNSTFCCELNDEVGYIRVWHFSSDYSSENEMIQSFMKNSGGKYKKLVIDIRGNDGGDPKYWMKVLAEPLIKQTTYLECYAAVKKKFIDKYGTVLKICKLMQGGIFNKDSYNFSDVVKSDFNESDDSSLQTYKVVRKFEPRNSFPFKGKVYLLVDRDCFSAAEDFASAVKRMKLATLVGTNTQGGAASLLTPYTFCLPESGIMFVIEPEITYNDEGRIDEIYGTKPDIELEGPVYPTKYPLSSNKEELLKDVWIQQVLSY